MNYVKQQEQYTEQGDSVEVYTFLVGGSYAIRYTSYFQDVIIDGNTYTRATIKRSSFGIDAATSAIKCTVTAPITDVFAEYVSRFPIEPTTIEIRKYFLTDTTQSLLLFSGKLGSVRFKDKICTAECVSQAKVFQTKVPRINYQPSCNNLLFDSVCGLAAPLYRETITGCNQTVNSGEVVLVSADFALQANGYYTGGTVVYNNGRYDEYRRITSHTGNTCKITNFPFSDSSNITVYAYPGCNKTVEHCRDKFNNLMHFVGFPYIPKDDQTSGNKSFWGW